MSKIRDFLINFKFFWASKNKTQKANLIAVIALLTILPASVAGVYTAKFFMGKAAYPVTPPITGPTLPPNGKANLDITKIEIRPADAPHVPCKSYIASITVKNTGSQPAPKSRMIIEYTPTQIQLINNCTIPTYLKQSNVPVPGDENQLYLNPNEEYTYSDYINPAFTGQLNISAELDVYNQVDESFEGDNSHIGYFTVEKVYFGPLPPLPTRTPTINPSPKPTATATASPRSTPTATAQACVKKAQTISIIPNTQYGSLGQTLTYTVTVKNNDSLTCPQSVFTLTKANLPVNWSASFDNNQLSIFPGKSASTKVRVKSATNAGRSNYTIYIRSKGPSFEVQSPLIYSITRILN